MFLLCVFWGGALVYLGRMIYEASKDELMAMLFVTIGGAIIIWAIVHYHLNFFVPGS